MPSAVARAVKAFRFAPRSYLHTLLKPARLADADVSDIERFASLFDAPPHARGAGHLLILSYLPLHYSCKVETLFARSLQERGWSVSVLSTASTERLARAYFSRILGAPVRRIEEFISFAHRREIASAVDRAIEIARRSLVEYKQFTYRDAPVGLSTIASLSATQPDGIIGTDEKTYTLLGKLLRQSLFLLHAADAMYEDLKPTLVISQEKGFVGTCETFYEALRRRIDYVQWTSCHEPDSVMLKRFSRETARDHPFSISDRTWTRLRRTRWHEGLREAVLAEFDRGYKSGDWFKYKRLSSEQSFAGRAELFERLGLDRNKKTAVIYSHILNDANLFYGKDLFAGGYEEWLVETVRAAASNPDVNWVLKLHPANVFRNARLGYTGEFGELLALRKAFGEIPGFLRIIRPDDKMSPLSYFGITDWGITVRGTVGVELPCFGVPVLTAGTGRYSGKGFTVDSASAAEYLERVRTIDRVPALTDEEVKLGILHAYCAFRGRPARCGEIFRDIYPEPLHHPRHRDVELQIDTIGDILAHPRMQAITDFLTSSNEDFVEPAVLAAAEAS